jgi:hypothetical protein
MVACFADFWIVIEYAVKCANLYFECVTIKMVAFGLEEEGRGIKYILLVNIYFMELDEWVGCVS